MHSGSYKKHITNIPNYLMSIRRKYLNMWKWIKIIYDAYGIVLKIKGKLCKYGKNFSKILKYFLHSVDIYKKLLYECLGYFFKINIC